MKVLRSRLFVLLSTLCVLGCGLSLLEAQAQDENYVAYRQRLMTGHGASMGSIGDILKYKLDFSPMHIEIHAKNIHEYAKLIPDAFKKEITAGANDAKPEIWKNWDDFTAKAKALEAEAGKLATVAAGGDMAAMMPQVKATGDACRSCHDAYRKPKEESYKSK